MNYTATIIASLGLAVAGSSAFAAAHAMDPQKVTCAEYITMDDEGKMGLAEAVAADAESLEADAAMAAIDENCGEEGNTTVSVYDAALTE